MSLLPGWEERILRAQRPVLPTATVRLPKSPVYYADKISFVDTVEKAEDLVQLAHERSLSHIGFDTEFRYERPGVPVGKKTAYDPRSVRPLLLSLALVEPTANGQCRTYRFV